MLHELKFKGEELCHLVYSGQKPFEIRKNDRDYKTGDSIKPISIDEDGNRIHHRIDNCIYEITYVVASWPEALRDDYCVFGLRLVSDSNED